MNYRFSYLLVLVFCFLSAATPLHAQTAACPVTVIDEASGQTLSCTVVLVDESEKELGRQNKPDGKFEMAKYKQVITSDGCVLQVKFTNGDYVVSTRKQLRCPISCNKRILAKKKPSAASLGTDNPFAKK